MDSQTIGVTTAVIGTAIAGLGLYLTWQRGTKRKNRKVSVLRPSTGRKPVTQSEVAVRNASQALHLFYRESQMDDLMNWGGRDSSTASRDSKIVKARFSLVKRYRDTRSE